MIRWLLNEIKGSAIDYIASKVGPTKDPRDAQIADLTDKLRELEIAATRVCDEITDSSGAMPTWLLDHERDALTSLRDLLRELSYEAAPKPKAADFELRDHYRYF